MEGTRRQEFDGVVFATIAHIERGDNAAARKVIEEGLLLRAQTALNLTGSDWPARDQFVSLMAGRVSHGIVNGQPFGAVTWGALWATFHIGYMLGLEEAAEVIDNLRQPFRVESKEPRADG